MKIFVDADSCPRQVRETVVRAAQRTGTEAVFAANRPIPGIKGRGITMELCPAGDGSADNRIVELAVPGDLVITRDIPLADRLVERGITVLDDRGRLYTRENIRERLSVRDFMVGLAENGMGMERNASYGNRELKKFADTFDSLLSRLIREEQNGKHTKN
ncbi:YaiI/YqxD family protein [Breznakiella homolactica]|uniref:UPF0178 protein JFL75_10395 n=1 Tax=Breznakiella homolactica TaxID=2798577 RepID=A0A7T7XJ49_9SPIR|nr:DUF188 domain-containing protein [Breznakiella homolactica]QQO07374.1 DUF188 domain-containing protein [Breznakiella homolactica]